MARDLTLSRDQGEHLVDLLEASGIPMDLDLAAEIRKLFGMGPYPAGSVNPPSGPEEVTDAAAHSRSER